MIGFSFKGRHSSTLDIGVRSADRTLMPQKRDNGITVSSRHGTIDPGVILYDRRYIRMVLGLINNADWSELRTNARDVAEWLSGTGELIFDDEPDKFYIAKIYDAVGIEQINLLPIGGTEITFSCQPFAYMIADTMSSDSWDEADYPWIIDLPWDNRLTYSFKVTNGGSFIFNNPGSQELDYRAPEGSKSIITITGSWTSLVVTMNDRMLIYRTSGNGTLVIDNIEMEVIFNGVNHLSYIDGDIDHFLPIKYGDNEIVIAGTGMNVNVSIDFRPMWI